MLISDSNGSLEDLVETAIARNAETVLLFPGRPPAIRLSDRSVEALTGMNRLHFHDTERMVDAMLNEEQKKVLDSGGDVELRVALETGKEIDATVFFGGGSHHLVLFLKRRQP